jgi:ABC-2 type transport system permease protein
MRFNPDALGWVALTFAVFLGLALWGFDPARGIMTRKTR